MSTFPIIQVNSSNEYPTHALCMMAGELRNWIAESVPRDVKLLLQWSEHRRAGVDRSRLNTNQGKQVAFEYDGSNLRVKKGSDIRAHRPVQILDVCDLSI